MVQKIVDGIVQIGH